MSLRTPLNHHPSSICEMAGRLLNDDFSRSAPSPLKQFEGISLALGSDLILFQHFSYVSLNLKVLLYMRVLNSNLENELHLKVYFLIAYKFTHCYFSSFYFFFAFTFEFTFLVFKLFLNRFCVIRVNLPNFRFSIEKTKFHKNE